jgi:rfaE bifunctional protein nucleotidyltransferase chain/domain
MITNIEKILKIISNAKQNKQKIVFTNGCFDIIHSGHCKYLSEAKQLGDILIIGLNTDASIKRIKGEMRPINNEINRAFVLASLRSVDYVVLFDEDTPFNLISKIIPDVLVKGSDYEINNIVGADIVMQNGGQVITIPLVEGQSTTNIISKLQNQN